MVEPTRPAQSAVNLIVHPVAGFAAASALGLGFIGQAFGLWAGAVAGAMEASQRIWGSLGEDREAGPRAPRPEAARQALVAELRRRAEHVARKAAATPSTPPASAGPLMPEDFRQPKAMEKPARPDDLKRISGVGPKLEQVLNGLGIWTHGQIAGWTAEEIAWVDDYLGFAGRIGRDGWVAQARLLARGRRV